MGLNITNLCKRYGEKLALDDFSYSFENGVYGIIGANGAGKSTLMNLISDNVKRDSGSILWNGEDILDLGKKFRSVLGYMPQQSGVYSEFSAREFLRYVAELKELPRSSARLQIEELLDRVNLKAQAHLKLGTFSGGMKQRVLLAQALLGDPRVLILDEPTAGLDPIERFRLREYIIELAKNKIVFMTTHIISDIESTASKILLLKNGRLIKHGTPKELIEEVNGSSLDDVYIAYLGGG